MTTLAIGIDPGLSGAVAILNAAGEVILLADLPIIRDLSLAWVMTPNFSRSF